PFACVRLSKRSLDSTLEPRDFCHERFRDNDILLLIIRILHIEKVKKLKEMQNYMSNFQKSLNWDIKGNNLEEKQSSILWNHLLLTTEVAEIALEFRKLFTLVEQYKAEGH